MSSGANPLLPVQRTQSAFHLHAQRNASRRRDVRQQRRFLIAGLTIQPDVISDPCTLYSARCFVIALRVLLAIASVISYISGGPRSFWEFMGLLLTVVGFLIALWLIWVLLQWVVEQLRRK
jgi:hypothetical protein